MIAQLLLFLLLVIFAVGSIGILLCQLNIFWQSAYRKKQQVNSVIKVQALSLKVVSRQELSERHFSVRLQRVDGEPLTRFLPGQYLTLLAESQPMQGSLAKAIQKRCYSLASWQKNIGCYELGIQRETDGQVSTWLHRHLQIGTVIKALPPKGNFVIDAKRAMHTVLVAGGIGITPLRAMVHQFIFDAAKDTAARKTMSLFYSAKIAKEMCYLDEFSQFAQQYACFEFYPFLSKVEESHIEPLWQGAIGRVSAEQLIAELELKPNIPQSQGIKPTDKTTCHYYMCGPNAMMDELKYGLTQQGIAESNIHFERFGVKNESSNEDKFTVKLGENINIEFKTQRTLLEAIEEQGLEIQSECRTGECGLCKIKLKKGKIKRLIETNVDLNEGEILSCCSVPASDLLIEV